MDSPALEIARTAARSSISGNRHQEGALPQSWCMQWVAPRAASFIRCQLACRTRARSSLKLARPYMERFSSLSRLTWPSTGPLLHSSVNAAATAASSWCRLAANDPNSAHPERCPRASQSPSVPGAVLQDQGRGMLPPSSPAHLQRHRPPPGRRLDLTLSCLRTFFFGRMKLRKYNWRAEGGTGEAGALRRPTRGTGRPVLPNRRVTTKRRTAS